MQQDTCRHFQATGKDSLQKSARGRGPNNSWTNWTNTDSEKTSEFVYASESLTAHFEKRLEGLVVGGEIKSFGEQTSLHRDTPWLLLLPDGYADFTSLETAKGSVQNRSGFPQNRSWSSQMALHSETCICYILISPNSGLPSQLSSVLPTSEITLSLYLGYLLLFLLFLRVRESSQS